MRLNMAVLFFSGACTLLLLKSKVNALGAEYPKIINSDVNNRANTGLSDGDLNLSQLFAGFAGNSTALRELVESLNHTTCGHDILKFVAGLNDREMWALSMLDAFGKPGTGIIYGDIFWEGSYQECLDVSHTARYPYNTQLCEMSIGVLLTVSEVLRQTKIDDKNGTDSIFKFPPVKIGICAPASCSKEELKNISIYLHGMLPDDVTNKSKILDISCLPLESEIWHDTRAVASIAICCVLAMLVLAGTLYDVFVYQPQVAAAKAISKNFSMVHSQTADEYDSDVEDINKLKSNVVLMQSELGIAGAILVAFSAFSNSKKILSLKQGEGSISCLHGLRVVSLCWVIFGHILFIGTARIASDNIGIIQSAIDTWWYQVAISGMYAVDTFLTISGVLLAYVFLKQQERLKVKRFPWLAYCLHRYIRITPSLVLVLLVWHMGLLKYMGSGATWRYDKKPEYQCVTYWWRNILYIHNFFPAVELCMYHTWYLAIEMQIYLAMSFILCFIVSRPRIAAAVGVAVFAISTATLTYTAHTNDLTIVRQMKGWENHQSQFMVMIEKVYIKPWNRIAPYLVGIALGWALYSTNCKFQMKKGLVWLVWIAVFSSQLYLIFLGYHAGDFSKTFTLLHYAFSRTIWGIGIAWIIFACTTGYGGIVNNFLSWPIFLPLSRLTYCAYLVHFSLIELFLLSRDGNQHFTETNLVYSTVGQAVLAYLLAFPISLAVESPIIAIEGYLLKLKKREQKTMK